MAIVYQKDKRSGLTYAYESIYHWDKEKKQSRCKRTLIGRVDKETGKIVPTDGRGRKNRTAALPESPKSVPVPSLQTARLFCGATSLFDKIAGKLGIVEDLKLCFPTCWKQLLSVAYYLILESENPLSRFSKWARLHRHPFGRDIPSQRSSELFMSITEEAKMKFFRLQGKRRSDNEYWAYDSTTISSNSECLKQVKWGKNKDYDPLPQISLALLFGEKSNLPFYYRKLAGNIPDVKTVKELIKELDILGYDKVKLVMDRGFYSAENINGLYKEHYKFIVAASTSLSYAKDAIREHGASMKTWERYNDKYELYVHSNKIAWDYTQERPYKGDVVSEDKRMYLHLYFNPEKAVEDQKNFNRFMSKLKEELLSKKHVPEHEKSYKKYFSVKETPVRGISIEPIQEAMDAARERYGFFVLLSNEVKDPVTALELYRNRDVVEKAFGNIKERLNCRRTLVSSDQSLDGKLFVEFISLIFLSYIKKQMQDKELFKEYTLQGLLDELDVIECFEEPGREPIVGEVLKKQEQIYTDMGVEAPGIAASLG